MNDARANEILGGTLLLLMLASSILAVVFASTVGTTYNVKPDQVPDVLRLVADRWWMHQLEIAFDLLSFIALVALSGAMYLIFASHNRTLATLGALAMAAGGIILAIHDVLWFVFPSVAKEYVLAADFRASFLADLGMVLMLVANWCLSVGIAFMGLGILLFGILFVRSAVTSLWIGWIGVVAGVLLVAGTWLPRVDTEWYMIWTIMSAPVLVWEASLGLTLILRGVNQTDQARD